MSKKSASLSSKSTVPPKSSKFDFFNQLLIIVILTTITVFPFIFDSFTVSKIFVLALGMTLITVQIYTNKSKIVFNQVPKILTLILVGFTASLILSWAISGVPLLRGLFGQFGRGNGLFYYLLVTLIFTFAIITFKNKSKPQAHLLITYLSWFLVIYATLQKLGIDIVKFDTRGISSVYLTFGNSNFAGGMLSVLFAYHFTHLIIKKDFLLSELLLIIALVVATIIPAAVQGYLIILFTLAVGTSLIVVERYKAGWIKLTLLFGWTTAIFMIVLGVSGKFIFSSIFARDSFQARVEYWIISLKVMRDNLLFGIGSDKLYDVSPLYMSPKILKIITTTRVDNAHNWYLNVGASYGIITLLFLTALLIYTLVACLHNLKDLRNINAVGVAASVAFMAMFIDGLVSIEQPGIGVWLYFFAGMAVASWKNAEDSINQPKRISFQVNSENSSLTKIFLAVILCALLLSVLTIGNRVVLDGKLRKNVQTILLNQSTEKTLENIIDTALRLRAEPEYIVLAFQPLERIGDVNGFDKISQASFDYYPSSIQAMLVRSESLLATDRGNEACGLFASLINKTPWDTHIRSRYVTCILDNFQDKNEITLSLISKYYEPLDKSLIVSDYKEIKKLITRLDSYANRARFLLINEQPLEADLIKQDTISIILRLENLLSKTPDDAIEEHLKFLKEMLAF